ncbi:MAG: hypothetical protein NUW23_09770 [Firmicutes bacterium]|jgi:N-acetylglucosamine kinase-like BadF-type ATPase|nr:hypothetical protein [Bacillota bacterium]
MGTGLVAAIDGGGTKTLFVIARIDGAVLGVGHGGALNTVFVPTEVARASVRKAAAEACRVAGFGEHIPVQVDALYVGAPGFSSDLALTSLDGLVQAAKLTVAADTLSAFVGALVEPFGVVALAGTGSFATGFNRAGECLTLGGWGALLGDEGSAYDIGLSALRAVVRASEGRAAPTVLTDMILGEWRLARVRDLVGTVYKAGPSRERIAGAAKIVSRAAEVGDGVAKGILKRAGEDLGALAVHVLSRLDLTGQQAPVALTGGVSRAGADLHDAFANTVQEADPGCRIVKPRFSPAHGALLLALRSAGVRTEPAILERLDETSAGFDWRRNGDNAG